jgi:23S rRNA (guanosine2251-2'-O)-methyltransferase
MKTEILYGYHPVLEAMRAGRRAVIEVYVVNEKRTKRLDDIEKFASGHHVPVRHVALSRMHAMVRAGVHQGVCARVGLYEPVSLSELLSKSSPPFVMLLDNIVDPQNLGALIRSAECVGVDGVVIPKDRSAPPTPAVSKASAGALEHICLARVTNMVETIKTLKQQGLWVMGLDKHSNESIFQSDLTGALALVAGGEAHGIRPLVRKHCDKLISIPQKSEVDSLNASAAGAVAMYEAFRQRRGY